MKKTFDISLVDPLSFIGSNDRNIKLLEDSFSVAIIVRGTAIKLNGNKNEVELLVKILDNMLYTVEQKGYVEENDVKNFIDSMTLDYDSLPQDIIDTPVVLHTYKGTVYAKTKGQKKYLDAVNNHDITFAVGPAGTGKTYQAVASAVSALKNKIVNKIVITRPAVEAGESLGFLPGDLKEKIDPYLTPLYDALDNMLPQDKIKKYMESKQIEIAPLAYMRGRTLHNAFIILDEAQNLTIHELKTIITRVGENTKIILTGDIEQIDSVYLDSTSNGLSYAVEKLKPHDLSGHMTLIKGERSKVATLASKIL